jgi:hypothetical protein
MDLMFLMNTGKRPATSIASSEARSPQTFLCKRRPGRAGDRPQDREVARARYACHAPRES